MRHRAALSPGKRARRERSCGRVRGFLAHFTNQPYIVHSTTCTGAHLQIMTFKRHQANVVQKRLKDRGCLRLSCTTQLRRVPAILFDFVLSVQKNIITNQLCATVSFGSDSHIPHMCYCIALSLLISRWEDPIMTTIFKPSKSWNQYIYYIKYYIIWKHFSFNGNRVRVNNLTNFA